MEEKSALAPHGVPMTMPKDMEEAANDQGKFFYEGEHLCAVFFLSAYLSEMQVASLLSLSWVWARL